MDNEAKESVKLPAPKPSSIDLLNTTSLPRRIGNKASTSAVTKEQTRGSSLHTSFPRLLQGHHHPQETTRKKTKSFYKGCKSLWDTRFRQLGIEGKYVDRTQVLHNIKENQEVEEEDEEDEVASRFLEKLPQERDLKNPSCWINPLGHSVDALEHSVSDKMEEAARVHRMVLALAAPKKRSSPRLPSPSIHLPVNDSLQSPTTFDTLMNSHPQRMKLRREDRIKHFIAELRADPNLWAAFQRDVENIKHQQRHKNTRNKIRENKDSAGIPRSVEAQEHRKHRADERMERTRRQREQLIQLEEERLQAKHEAYLRQVDPSRHLVSGNVSYRRRKLWLHIMTFAAVTHRWHHEFLQAKHRMAMTEVQHRAASTIQRIWRKWKWQTVSKHTVVIYSWLSKCLWKLLLKVRCRRKAQHATLLQRFMLDHSTESHAKRNFHRMMLLWRSKVIRAQRTGLSFIHCNRARMHALSIWWDNVDHERQRLARHRNTVAEKRRVSLKRDSLYGSISSGNNGTLGSGNTRRKGFSMATPLVSMAGVDEKLANMQMLLKPVEIKRLNQNSTNIVKIPKSIKVRLLTELLANARSEFRRKQQGYKQMRLSASYAREVKLEEARAIVQGSMNRNGVLDMTHTNASWPPPCFFLFSNPKAMEILVRRGVEITLEAELELKVRQQDPSLPSPPRSSVSFSTIPLKSPPLSPRSSILKSSFNDS